MMKRYAKGGDLNYWSADQIKSFEFMQRLGVPQKSEMLKKDYLNTKAILPFFKAILIILTGLMI